MIRRTGLFALLVLSYAMPICAKTYFVSEAGRDRNTGLSPDAPWQSLNKANLTTFRDDDTISFRCGDTFTGGLYPYYSSTHGSKGHPVTYTRYGTCDGTNDPTIDGDLSGRTWEQTGEPHVYRIDIGVGTQLHSGTAAWNVFVDGVPVTHTTKSDDPMTYASGTWGPFRGLGLGTSNDHIYLRLSDDSIPNTTHRVTVLVRSYYSARDYSGSHWITPSYLTLDHLHFRSGTVTMFDAVGFTIQHVKVEKTIGIAFRLNAQDSTIDDLTIHNFSTNGLYVANPVENGMPNNLRVSGLHISCGGIGHGRECGLGDATLDPFGFVAETDGEACDCTCTGWQSTSGVSVTDSDFDYCDAGMDVTWGANFKIQRNRFNCSKGIGSDCGGIAYYGMDADISHNYFDGESRRFTRTGLNVRWVNLNIGSFGGPKCPAPCVTSPIYLHDNVIVHVADTAITLSASEPLKVEAYRNVEQFVYPRTAKVSLFSVSTDSKNVASKPILMHDNTFVVPNGVPLASLPYNWIDGPHADGIAGFEAISGGYHSEVRNGP